MNQTDCALDYFLMESSPVSFSCSYGTSEGKHLVVVGGTHGNEPAGVEAMCRVHKWLCEKQVPLCGRVSFVVGNPEAYRQGVRYIDHDLNRAFIHDVSSQTVEGRRVQELRAFFAEQEDIYGVLDLHSVSRGHFKMVAYSAEHPKNMRLARRISPLPLHFMYHASHLSGLLVDDVMKRNIDAVAVECGNHTAPDAVTTAYEHILSFLREYSLLEGLPQCLRNEECVRIYETLAPIKPGKGFLFLDSQIVSETFLREGEFFAYDEDIGYHKVPRDCYIMMPSKTSNVLDPDAGFLCLRR